MEPRPTQEQVRWFRLRRSGLVEPFVDPLAAATALVGVQAQILSAALLALWNRSATGAGTQAELTTLLFEQRSLIRLWGQRHTLHLYASADWPLIHAAFAERKTWWERQAVRDPSIDLAAYRADIQRVAELLKRRGTLGRKDLRAPGVTLAEGLLSPWGGVFAELVRLGIACHAQWEDGEARYAHREHWLPGASWAPPSAEAANRELVRRYFAHYGPATIGDFGRWRSGGVLRQAQAWIDALGDELMQVAVHDPAVGQTGALYLRRVDRDQLFEPPPPREQWPVRLLGRFDPLLLAHKVKDWIVPEKVYARVWRPAGHIEGVVLEHGRAIATWRYERIGASTLAIRVFPFRRPLPRAVGVEVRRQARELARFFGIKKATVRVERGMAAR